MLTDVDLDEVETFVPNLPDDDEAVHDDDGDGDQADAEDDGASQHSSAPSQPQHMMHSAPLLQTANTASRRRTATMRGRPSYLFSAKRPRRNVVRRSIASLHDKVTSPPLEHIDEERQTLLGFDVSGSSKGGHGDPRRAPKLAFGLLLVVCTMGGYRGISEHWTARRDARSGAMERGEGSNFGEGEEFPGLGDGEHRGALLQLSDGIGNNLTNIEEIPTTLFDETIEAPSELSNLVDIFHEQYNPQQNKLFLWHVPRSGTTTVARVASYCLGLTIASAQGKSEVRAIADAHGGDVLAGELRIVEGLDGVRFANVDTSNPEGIGRAKALNVGSDPRIDLVSSPYLWDLAGVFDEVHRGYMVAMFRHPIERAVSLYYSMRKNPEYKKQVESLTSVEQYAKSSLVENNWMTRFLSNTLSGELTPEHEAIAKEVLRTKCLVGLLRDKTETMRRLEAFFDVRAAERTRRRDECQEKLLYWDWPGKNRHDPVVPGSEAWETLLKQNTFDLRLYEYAERLFVAQGKLFQNVPSTW